jgi:hypothetical protein
LYPTSSLFLSFFTSITPNAPFVSLSTLSVCHSCQHATLSLSAFACLSPYLCLVGAVRVDSPIVLGLNGQGFAGYYIVVQTPHIFCTLLFCIIPTERISFLCVLCVQCK